VAGDGLRALETELRAPAPQALRALSDAQLHDLATAVRDARHRQADELTAAGEKALRHIPRLLRAPVRRVMR
jgi:hypothetical protein